MAVTEDFDDLYDTLLKLTAKRQPASQHFSEALFKECHKDACFYGAAVYDTQLLKLLLTTEQTTPRGEDLRSAISKCIERGLPEALDLLLPLDHGLPDKCLYLRRVDSVTLYVIARETGWRDVEWEQRIILLQRRWREYKAQRGVSLSELKYAGPEIGTFTKEGLYFGYRHSMYKARWDRRNRHRYYKQILTSGNWGWCVWQAYVDYVEKGDESNLPHVDSRPRLPLPPPT